MASRYIPACRVSAMKTCTSVALGGAVVAFCLCVVLAAPAAGQAAEKPTRKQLLYLARLMTSLKEMSSEANGLGAAAGAGDGERRLLAAGLLAKRGTWAAHDDYGLGGGRFGKRTDRPVDTLNKKYDMYGTGGRFGRDVDHVDPDSH